MAELSVLGSMVRPVKPGRKRDGRLGPPQGYPKDPDKYGDPANWKYPVHTPFHARAARRYFNEPRNRAKYTPEEQAYIDKKINEPLERSAHVQAPGRVPHASRPREGDPPLARPVTGTGPLDLRMRLTSRGSPCSHRRPGCAATDCGYRSEAAEVRLAIFLPCFALLRLRERRVTSGARASGVHATLAQPRSARVPFDTCSVMRPALRRSNILYRPIGGLRYRHPLPLSGRLVFNFDFRFRCHLRLRLLPLDLRHPAGRDLVAAALEDLEGDLELLRFEGPEVQLLRQIDEIPFLLREVHRLPDQVVVVPLRRRLEGRITDPVDVTPDRPGFFQVHVGQDRADIREAQRVQVLGVLHRPEDGGAHRLVLPQIVGLNPVGR